ncbi:hypothetical protein FF1_004482 [Malus domestica]
MLVGLKLTATQPHLSLQLVTGYEHSVLHLLVFGCTIYLPIAPPLRTKMGHQRKMGIYVGYDSPSIVRYLEPLIEDFFTACFVDCHFDETIFLLLGGYKHANIPVEHHELSWYALIISHLDPCTTQFETEVQPIIDLQSIAQSMSDAFNDLAKVTRSHILITNAPAMIDVPCVRQQPIWEYRTVPEGGEATPSTRQGTLVAS